MTPKRTLTYLNMTSTTSINSTILNNEGRHRLLPRRCSTPTSHPRPLTPAPPPTAQPRPNPPPELQKHHRITPYDAPRIRSPHTPPPLPSNPPPPPSNPPYTRSSTHYNPSSCRLRAPFPKHIFSGLDRDGRVIDKRNISIVTGFYTLDL